jgi:hypothetical protein
MQEPLDNLSENARVVYEDLDQNPDENRQPDAIAQSLGGQVTPGEVAHALRELQAAGRAAEAFGGWSIVR